MKFTTGVKFGDLERGDMFTFAHRGDSVLMKIRTVFEGTEDHTYAFTAVWVRDGENYGGADCAGSLAEVSNDAKVIRLYAE